MANIKVRFLVEKKNTDGTIRRYWQPPAYLRADGWPTMPLKDEHGNWMGRADAIAKAEKLNTELDEWRQGDTANPSQPDRSLDGLIDHYKKSNRYRRLKPRSQGDYKNHLDRLSDWSGDLPAAAITPAAVQAYYEALFNNTPHGANGRIRVLRLLLQYGIRIGWLTQNAATKPGLMNQKVERRLWSDQEIGLMVETADKIGRHSMGTLIMMGAWLGHYPSDLITMTRAQYDGRRFSFRRQKTDNPISVPDNRSLRERLNGDQLHQNQDKKIVATHLVRNEATGRPYTQSGFNKAFRELRAEAAKTDPAVKDLQFRLLRHTAVTRMAEDELTTAQIAAFSAHSMKQVEQILERYLVRTDKTADAGAKKRRQ